jgi:flavin reductase (DIM6/NTAB) family NADH-FMN oxidoreductase RutF
MNQTDDLAAYRQALGRFPTGVAFVGASAPEGDTGGVLINSFTSVSLAPPMVLWCLGLASRSRRFFASAPTFAVSVLAEEQRPLISALARPAEQRLVGLPLRKGLGGAPVIEGAAAVFECQVMTVTRAGDHEVYLGEVVHFERSSGSPPLAFMAGQYGRVQIAA